MSRNLIGKFKPCPICGRDGSLVLLSKDSFEELQNNNGYAAVNLECVRCNIEMWEFTFDERNYDLRVDYLADKWNKRFAEEEAA